MVVFGWLIIAAVVLGVGLLLASVDRRSRRKGHMLRGSSKMSTSLREKSSDARVIYHTRGRLLAQPTSRKL
jgi:hypothetical protein